MDNTVNPACDIMRLERDSLGEVELPENSLYGAQTQRAIGLYPSHGQKVLSDYPSLIDAILLVKAAAARTNGQIGELSAELSIHIENACQFLRDNFNPNLYPVNALHGGGGISTNMNISEVIANYVNKQNYNMPLGSYSPAHPNDHLNANLSTSDTLFTASSISIYQEVKLLLKALTGMCQSLNQLKIDHKNLPKISRTCLQDAVAIEFSNFWGGCLSSLQQYKQQIEQQHKEFLLINLGANIIGRSGDSSPEFAAQIIKTLAEYSGENYQRHRDFFQCSQSHDSFYLLSSTLESLAHWLIKIAKDLRLMASGPETGLQEIILPAVQPGSSAMPGKINPTIPEYLIQCAMQAIGHIQAIKLAQTHAELDYTPWGMVSITNSLDALQRLTDGINCFSRFALQGLQTNNIINEHNINSLIPTIISLKKYLGYSETSRLVNTNNLDLEKLTKILNKLKQEG